MSQVSRACGPVIGHLARFARVISHWKEGCTIHWYYPLKVDHGS